MTQRIPLIPLAFLLVSCGGAVPEDDPATEDELTTSYADLIETLPPADLDRWMNVRSALIAGFDRICGDTICSGDYSNLTTVHLTCSSTTKARKLKGCSWILGGSIDAVDARSGNITTAPRVFECKIPVAGTAKQLLDALAPKGADALNTPIPGTGKSFYDGLTDCFAGVVGAPQPASSGDAYVDLTDYLWSVDGAIAWLGTTHRLAAGFNQACGDAFCEGDYPRIAPLRFVCAMNRKTKRVARCAWSFAMAETSVGAGGVIAARTATQTCNVEIGATASELTTALAGDDPLHANLPRRATSIYDALIGCL